MKNCRKNVLKSKNGITLIALVITIIVLLILAGISISMLSGDNGILTQTSNAKIQTDIAEEKEILQMSILSAISKEKYGDINKEKLDGELNKYPEIENTEQNNNGIVVTFKSNRQYLVNSNGDISSYYDIIIENLIVKDGNTILADNCKSVQLGKALTINFDASIANGQILSITPNISYTTTGEKNKTFTIVAITSEGNEITKEYTVDLKGYYNIPELKVGDYVEYDVTYQDIGITKEFGKNDGWRLLNKKDNEDETYDIEIISTGVPTLLYYASAYLGNFEYDGITGGKWVGNAEQRTTFASEFYTSGSNDNRNISAAAGLYYNFSSITFMPYPTGNFTSSYLNYGSYKKINGKASTTNGAGNLQGTEFITPNTNLQSGTIIGVRSVTIADIYSAFMNADKDESENYFSSTDSGYGPITSYVETNKLNTTDKALGLFKTQDCLQASGQKNYWLASPYSGNSNKLWYVNSGGSFGNYQRRKLWFTSNS